MSSSFTVSSQPRPAASRGGRARTGVRLGLALWACALLPVAAVSARAACDAGSQQPDPLPSVSDPDPLRARWAELRRRELSELATGLETRAPVEAHRLWLRARCLDPTNSDVLDGVARTFPVAIHRPAVTVVAGEAPEIHAWDLDPWTALGSGLVVHVAPPPPLPAKPGPMFQTLDASTADFEQVGLENENARSRAPDPLPPIEPAPDPEVDPAAQAAERERALEDLDEQLAEVAEALRTARFRFGLVGLEDARAALDRLEPGADLPPVRVRLETLAATAHVALGQRDDALESLLRALDADPDLALDPVATSPKVLRTLRLARATRSHARVPE